jgi:DNA-binding transcriptional ArsR family regulator
MPLADADLATVGRALGDPHRARFVLALLGGQQLSAGELANLAGASSSLTSAHLAKLLDAGLVTASKRGRNRHYRLASSEVARSVESLLAIAPPPPTRGLAEVTVEQSLRRARTCYDHLAGRLGVALVEAFENHQVLTACDSGWELTDGGKRHFGALGVDVEELWRSRRTLIRPCLDWTERRPHLAGGLGAALAGLMFDLGWIRRSQRSRAVSITELGADQLLGQFAIRI